MWLVSLLGSCCLWRLKKDQYNSISQLTPLVDNLVYYCKLNHCAVVNKRLLHDHLSFVTQAADVPSICSSQAEQTNLHCIISEISAKIDDLHSQNTSLQQQITNTSASLTSTSNDHLPLLPEPPALSTLGIADELADRERRRENIIIYNLPEPNDRAMDKTNFKEMCNAVFNIDASFVKFLWFGRPREDKSRPLLVSMTNIHDQEFIISHSFYLWCHSQYEKDYISQDMTKYQRNKHKQSVDELKRRRINEPNLIIWNGSIIPKPLCTQHSQDHANATSVPMDSTNQSSSVADKSS